MILKQFIINTLQTVNSAKPISYMKALKQFSNYDGSWDSEVKIRILRNYSIEPIEPFLQFFLYAHGIKGKITYSDYDAYQQEILDANSRLHQENHDYIILALIPDNIKLEEYFGHEAALEAADDLADHMNWLIENLTKSLKHGQLITMGIPPHFYGANGPNFDATAQINRSIKKTCSTQNVGYIDIDKAISFIGWQKAFDNRTWMMQKAPWTSVFSRNLAKQLVRSIALSRGGVKKLIILDCDNTLWGGVLGEDGTQGVALSRTEYPGSIFYAAQKILLDLFKNGALLALCSKNNESDVLKFLKEHPDNLIQEHHLAAWRINWKNKAENILDLAKELNIGTDSFIFVDDSPVECKLISDSLPEVTVLEVPQQISEFPNKLMSMDYFDRIQVTEDKNRTQKYQIERERKSSKQSFTNIEDFIKSLNIKINVGFPSKDEIARVAQLTQKTNQFNLTTIRYTEADVVRIASAPNSFILKLQAEDKFGDYGLTGVAIVRRESKRALIDSLMLSCRILGRKIENSFTEAIISVIRDQWDEVTEIQTTYIKTQKNSQVECFWENLGFTITQTSDTSKNYIAEIQKLTGLNEKLVELTIS